VGAICIRALAVRIVAGFFLVLLPVELDFTGVVVFLVCEGLVDFADTAGFLVAVGFAVVDCAASIGGADKIHKPPASNSPPAAREILVCVLSNAPL
jgi:hypothetical protein